MIKHLHSISQKDLDYLVSHPYIIIEKMDMMYFRVQITKVGAIPLKGSAGKVISDIDCITNSVYKEICEFVNKNINPVRNKIIEEYGEGYIGFFYLPTEKYNIITYKTYSPKSVILSDWSYDMSLLQSEDTEKINNLADIINCFIPPVLDNQKLQESELLSIIKDYIENKIDPKSFVNAVCDIEFNDDLEGIIIRNNKFQYQVSVVDTSKDTLPIDKDTKLSYRNILLKSLIEFYKNNKEELNTVFKEKESYVDRISYLFLKYIENTDIFSKYSFDPEDFLPPGNSYMGDIDFDMVTDGNVKLICKYNEVYKNIFRMMLHTFATKVSEDKFRNLSKDTSETMYDVEALHDLIINLNYRNYKEILLTAYKAQN